VRAFSVLRALETARGTLAEQLALADAGLDDPRERGFLHELVLGTLRIRGRLDHALAALLDRPLARVDAGALAALRLGAYQILELRVPDRAAVSESVDLVRVEAPAAAGFVNAVLRRLAREGAAPLPDPERQPEAWLTSAGSLPAWLASRWLKRLGPAAAVAKAKAFLEKPSTALRLNPRAPGARQSVLEAGIELAPLAVPGAFEARTGRPAPLAEAGLVYIQDEGSQLVAHLASGPGLILDACAAPGGKATLMADLGEDRLVVATEPGARRRETMAGLVRRWGTSKVCLVGADARRPPFEAGCFDSVLLDAPCSGLGTLGRHPDVRWRTLEADILRHARLQTTLLTSLAPLVRAGGRLVYATCSSEPEENEQVVTAFLSTDSRFRLAPLPAWASVFADGPYARTGREASGDMFFAAVLQRT